MKKIIISLAVYLVLFSACKKDDAKQSSDPKPKSGKLSYLNADQIPNEIVALLYKDLLKDHLFEQAENLRVSYYNTLSVRKDSKTDILKATHEDVSTAAKQAGVMAANFPSHSVPSVGVVLNCNEVTTQGSTGANLQAIGWSYINFGIMNPISPDDYNNPTPTADHILGTTGQSRRLEAYRLPVIQFSATDDQNVTYYTPEIHFTYNAHVEAIGWQSYVSSPNGIAGTVGLSRRIEGIQIYGPGLGNPNYTLTFNDSAPSTSARLYIFYRVHQDGYGWESWTVENGMAGHTGQSKRIEAMQVRTYLVKI